VIEPTLASFPPTRRAVVELLKQRGEASAADLASELALTAPAVRGQLKELEDAGFVAHRSRTDGRGRPTHCYSLTPAAGALFPQRYGDLTNELLDYVDPALVPDLFEKRRQRRTEGARARLEGRPFPERVVELARILNEDGYLASAEQVDERTWRIIEGNCAILDVALRYGHACSSELAFLRDVVPDADIERVSHIVAGARACAYELRLRDTAA
jgi:DeoR family transcriptional regulator, suf operon transcriptional repressor